MIIIDQINSASSHTKWMLCSVSHFSLRKALFLNASIAYVADFCNDESFLELGHVFHEHAHLHHCQIYEKFIFNSRDKCNPLEPPSKYTLLGTSLRVPPRFSVLLIFFCVIPCLFSLKLIKEARVAGSPASFENQYTPLPFLAC